MKNQYKKIYDVMELLQDSFIEEAMEEEEKPHRIFFWKYIAVAAFAGILIIVSIKVLPDNIFKNDSSRKTETVKEPGSKEPETIKEEEAIPRIRYEKSIKDEDSLEKITCSLQTEGAGGGNYGWFVIKSPKDLASKNPTRNNTKEITELPVFKNEKGLASESMDKEDFKEDDIYFGHQSYEETRDYPYDGTAPSRWGVCFRSDTQESLTQQLLEYTFYRLEFSILEDDENGVMWGYSIMKPPSGKGKMYPLISLEQAEEKLRKGEFFSHNPYDKDVAGTAKILSVELEYLTQEYQVYLQPFYKFIITDKSWDLSDVMKCENWEEYTSASEVYVPAVQEKYLDIRGNAQLRTN
ncbi:MAG: hypothetical protein K1W15_00825 [Lachnospiraceae bacterium]